ncbi:MAG: Gfo/Idh/MocA family protein [Beutenbergiaceae bacterium]
MSTYPEVQLDPAYQLALPSKPRPIVILGAGGIVRDAHLPAYQRAGYQVAVIADRQRERAQALADQYGIEVVCDSVAQAVAAAPADAVFDVALMPEHFEQTLRALPDGAAVLLQKPLGHTLAAGQQLLQVCREKQLVAAVNTQLRFAPYVAVARELIASGAIGEIYDMEVYVEVNTPWAMFPAVLTLPRLELNMHSVHYFDLVRSFFGDPDAVSATTVHHPAKDIANTRTTALMRYRDRKLRVTVMTNHDHEFGPTYEQSFVKWEGTEGAIRLQLGLLLDYPQGREDKLEMVHLADSRGWVPVPFEGSWFPDAFMYSMGVLQRFVTGEIDTLPTAVADVINTMAVVEAAYDDHEHGGTVPEYEVT